MKVFNVGPNDLEDDDIEQLPYFDWVVYWYKTEPYEGSGDLVGYVNSELQHFNLGHCSCYGPTDSETWSGNIRRWTTYSVEEFFSPNTIFDEDIHSSIKQKVAELLGVEVPQYVSEETF